MMNDSTLEKLTASIESLNESIQEDILNNKWSSFLDFLSQKPKITSEKQIHEKKQYKEASSYIEIPHQDAALSDSLKLEEMLKEKFKDKKLEIESEINNKKIKSIHKIKLDFPRLNPKTLTSYDIFLKIYYE